MAIVIIIAMVVKRHQTNIERISTPILSNLIIEYQKAEQQTEMNRLQF